MILLLHIIISKVMLRYASFDIIYPAVEIQQFNNASDYITSLQPNVLTSTIFPKYKIQTSYLKLIRKVNNMLMQMYIQTKEYGINPVRKKEGASLKYILREK